MSIPDDSQTLDSLYREHNGWLRGWLRNHLDSYHDAEDLTHETFLRLHTHAKPLNNLSKARSYLRVMASRMCIDMWRRKSVERAWLEVVSNQPEALAVSPEQQAIIVETFSEIDEMLSQLPERVATAFVLSQIEGMTYRQIGEQLGVSERSVKTYMARAMLECMRIEARFDQAVNS
ncbi:MAG: sigma-70 family RNA polymerase sigma factor [Pseudomonadota bacterium]